MRTGTAPAGSGLGAEIVDLGDGFRVIAAGETNVLAVSTGDGLALVDGGSAAQSAALLRRIAEAAGTNEVRALFNTHWHPEQTGSNEVLGKAGTTIVAHENTRLWLTTDVTWPWSGETVQPLPKAALPAKTFYTKDASTVGGVRIECGYLRDCPHTDGDMYVYFPERNVLAVGGAVTGAGWPSIDWWTGGWIGGIVGGLDMLLTVANAETRIVPAEGPVLRRADLEAQYEMYSVIWARLLKTLYGGGGPKEAHEIAPTAEFDATMGPSAAFVQRAFESLWAYLSPDA
ncbi:MAG TPA: MBL fold metallo-hydrolase [Gammaproteobacteria bacterium]|nr:MBL fold metallo-hydrolase [Gammaproteobacteria bacterium]